MRPAGIIVPLAAVAIYLSRHRVLKGFAFTAWVFVFVATSLFYPRLFGVWFGLDLRHLMVPLIQVIMFGMGTTLHVSDFARILKRPWPVFVGMLLQFGIMPLGGYAVAKCFGFEPEIAAGVILVGAAPGGVASNVMTYLAGGDVPLSVTMTSCSTLMSPVMTPVAMKILAGRLVPIHFAEMMLSIINMIVVPIAAGLAANKILYGRAKMVGRSAFLIAAGVILTGLAIIVAMIPAGALGGAASLKGGLVIGFVLIGAVAATRAVVQFFASGTQRWMDRVLPILSMAGICFIIAIITARSSEKLLSVGIALIAASAVQNIIGYISGYWLARMFRLDETIARTVSIEVGMQNAGMASGLAMTVLNSASAALAPAIFGPWMNISGSVLANWWHGKPVRDGSIPKQQEEVQK